MKRYITHDPWKIIEDKFHPEYQKISESLFSIGNGQMGQRANHEEGYLGETLQGSYLAGIYYPDKTRVGWWKNGYPEYFAKVLNSPNWINIDLVIDQHPFDLREWEILSFRRVLDMQNGMLQRTMQIQKDDVALLISAQRLCHYQEKDCGLLTYSIKPLKGNIELSMASSIEGDVRNSDANYDEDFWTAHTTSKIKSGLQLTCRTRKTDFQTTYSLASLFRKNETDLKPENIRTDRRIAHRCTCSLSQGEMLTLEKYVIVHSSLHEPPEIQAGKGEERLRQMVDQGIQLLFTTHKQVWRQKWAESDIQITGDVAAQQGIRFNIFQLHQTYSGDDPRLNIGPKGFTGEKYGGSTYWDTEAYCLPFYLSTAPTTVARNLLVYRYRHLEKAIENANKLGFDSGAALYPMVTMTGEECHNEWEITFEEIHRNGAIAHAIYYYEKYTGDNSYRVAEGAEVLVGIARFWAQRVHYSEPKQAYVIHGVTGPNEYEKM